MDEAKVNEAKQLMRSFALELEQAAAAARSAVAASDAGNQDLAWKELQLLYARFDEATQLLKDMRRAVDAALAPRP
jgi:hypothetical protein